MYNPDAALCWTHVTPAICLPEAQHVIGGLCSSKSGEATATICTNNDTACAPITACSVEVAYAHETTPCQAANGLVATTFVSR